MEVAEYYPMMVRAIFSFIYLPIFSYFLLDFGYRGGTADYADYILNKYTNSYREKEDFHFTPKGIIQSIKYEYRLEYVKAYNSARVYKETRPCYIRFRFFLVYGRILYSLFYVALALYIAVAIILTVTDSDELFSICDIVILWYMIGEAFIEFLAIIILVPFGYFRSLLYMGKGIRWRG